MIEWHVFIFNWVLALKYVKFDGFECGIKKEIFLWKFDRFYFIILKLGLIDWFIYLFIQNLLIGWRFIVWLKIF